MMKRLICGLLFFLSAAAASAQITIEQTANDSGSIGSGTDHKLDVTFASTTGTTETVLVAIAVMAEDATPDWTFSDDGGNTWNLEVDQSNGSDRRVLIGYAVATSAVDVVTVTASGDSAFTVMSIYEVSGCNTTTPLADSASESHAATTDHDSGDVTHSGVAILFGGLRGDGGSYSSDGSFSLVVESSTMLHGYNTYATGGTNNFDCTSLATEDSAVGVIAINEAGGATPDAYDADNQRRRRFRRRFIW